MMKELTIAIKLVIVGDASVEKTVLLLSYLQDKIPLSYDPTVFDNYCATVMVGSRTVALGLWDTSGQEEYDRLRPLAYPNCDVFLIVFSVIEPSSFVNARKKWYPELQENVGNVPKIFVGTKIELREEYALKNTDPKYAPIKQETARKVIEEEFQCLYMECSSLTKQGLNAIFEEAAEMAIKKKMKSPAKNNQKPPSQQGCFLI